jgi:hypothetical protein
LGHLFLSELMVGYLNWRVSCCFASWFGCVKIAVPQISMRRLPVRVACIGSREIPPESADACREMGIGLVRAGYTLVTGATPGVPDRDEWANWADGAFATGAYYANPVRLIVCLPWQHFPRGSSVLSSGMRAEYAEKHPEWEEFASSYWNAQWADEANPWAEVPRAIRLRHVRNVGVILQSRLVLAWPHGEAEGTRFAMGFADWYGVPLIDLSLAPWHEALAALVAQAATGVLSGAAG